MTLFWALAGTMVAASLVFLLRPLLTKPEYPEGGDEANAARIELFKEQLARLERDAAAGAIPAQRVNEAREDLARGLARALDPPPPREDSAVQRPAIGLGIVLCLGIPTLSFLGYLHYGSPATLNAPPTAPATQRTPPDVGQMIRQLETRLQTSPEDGAGWRLLGRSYFVLERYQASAAAYAKAERLLQADADLLIESAEAHAFAAGNKLAGKPKELLDRAMLMNSEHPKGLWLSGFAALQAGKSEQALDIWTKLQGQLRPQSPEARTLARLITQIGLPPEGQNATPEAPPTAPTVSASGPRLRARVSLHPSLAQRVTGSETVFIFAKAVQGPPMPLAAVKRLASELPLTVYLDDGSAMVAGANLSSTQSVTVGARVSGSGTPTPRTGDLEGSTGPISIAEFDVAEGRAATEKTVEVIIRQVVP